MLENRFNGVGQIGARSFNGVVSTESLPASAAEVYIAFARFSPGQVELMKALIIHKDPGCHGGEVGTSIASSGEFDFKNLLETAIGGIMKGNVAREEASILLEFVKLYREIAISNPRISSNHGLSDQRFIGAPDAREANPSTAGVVSVDADEIEDQARENPGNSVMKISGFLEEYIKLLQPTRSESYVRDARSAFKWLMEKVGDIALRAVESRTVEQLLAAEFGKASHNAARFYRTLKAAFNKAKSWEHLSENPFEKFKLPRIPETTAPHFNESDFGILLQQKLTKDYKEFFAFSFYTGARLSEVRNIRWDSVDLVTGKLKVTNYEGYRTKSKKERFIPIAPRLLEMLKERYSRVSLSQRTGYVFQRRGKRFNSNYASRLLKQTVRRAGLEEKLHFHSLRHGFGSELIHKNVNPVHVKELMGHANLSTTLRYVHTDEDDLKKAVNKLGRSEQDQP